MKKEKIEIEDLNLLEIPVDYDYSLVKTIEIGDKTIAIYPTLAIEFRVELVKNGNTIDTIDNDVRHYTNWQTMIEELKEYQEKQIEKLKDIYGGKK